MNSVPVRGAVVAAVLSALGWSIPARADLYTDRVASIEWQIDSADTIFLGRIVGLFAETRGFQQQAVLKPMAAQRRLTPSAFNNCRRLAGDNHVGQSSEWLLFTRGQGKAMRIFGAVNLSDPMSDHFRYAAISMVGKGNARILPNKETILARVRRRVRENHPLLPACDRDMTDWLAVEPAGSSGKLPGLALLGGDVMKVDIDHWDANTGDDTLIRGLLVPQTPGRPPLPKERRIEYWVSGYRAEAIRANLSRRKLPAEVRSLVGSWKLDTVQWSLELNLHGQGSFLCRITPRAGKPLSKHHWYGGLGLGAGTWRVGGEPAAAAAQSFRAKFGGRFKQ